MRRFYRDNLSKKVRKSGNISILEQHIAIDLITRSLTGIWRKAVVGIVQVVTALIAAFFAWQSWRFIEDSRLFEDVLLGDWPAWWFQLILPIGFGLVAYRYLIRALTTFGGARE